GARIRASLIRRDVGIESHGLALAHIEVELFGGDLQQRSRSALAELGESDVDCRSVIGVDGEPGVGLFRIGGAGDGAAGIPALTGRGLRLKDVAQWEADD